MKQEMKVKDKHALKAKLVCDCLYTKDNVEITLKKGTIVYIDAEGDDHIALVGDDHIDIFKDEYVLI
jgi:hypothetical protein